MKLEIYFILLVFFSCNDNGKNKTKVNLLKDHYISNFNNDTIIGNKKLHFNINSFEDSVLIEITSSNDSFLIKHFGYKMNEYDFQDYVNSIPSQYVHSDCQISPVFLDKRLTPPNNFNNFRVNKTDYYIVSKDSLSFQINYLYFEDGTLKQLISKYKSRNGFHNINNLMHSDTLCLRETFDRIGNGNGYYYINNLIHSDTLNLWEAFDEEYDVKFKIYNYKNLGYDSIAVFNEMDFLPDSFYFSNSIISHLQHKKTN